MNERIRELGKQAGSLNIINKVWSDDGPPIEYVIIDGNSMYSVTYLEKFAELIIRECMSVVRDINQEYDGGSTVVNAADEIRDYFGFEE